MTHPADPPVLRLRRPDRQQVTPVPLYLDALLPDEHLARLIWAAVERLDLSAFTAQLKVVEGGPGRAGADPAVLVAVWIYATSQGESSARQIARLCAEHFAYIWICGGVSMNYHSLADFRVAHEQELDHLITEVLGCLHHAQLIDFDHVAQDGIRVRASAGAASFRREESLQTSVEEARAVLAAVQAEGAGAADGEAGPRPRVQQAAQQRAAQERVARVEAALAELPAVRAAKPEAKAQQARVSTTDPEARVMKMADGGYRPAYNIELAADSGHQVIVGVEATNVGSDMAQAPPMVAQVQARLDQLPERWLMDGGFAGHAAIEAEAVEAAGPQVRAPVPQPKDKERDRYTPRPGDSAVIQAWRTRMGTAEAQGIYRVRAATIECVNAHARSRLGLQQF